MNFDQIDITGCRAVAALTRLGFLGPRHHAIVVGRNTGDGQVYLAESTREAGYRLLTMDEFVAAYGGHAAVRIEPNRGSYSDAEVAQRALDELMSGGEGRYHLVLNNCESFSNRAMHNHSVSHQVVNTVLGVVTMIGSVWLFRRRGRFGKFT
ncbi:MAG: hypothetical protein Kow006_22960 [Gammaproteobacteria bacterium]